ncbi:MAG: YggS family pyridoxal phosphate-dependent enzyme [Sedimentisphaerales bacterium]|nr:YggS family pyridoxal phosphate-dependent enzyme [Sedimentisphaerales bacterium]
MGLPLVKKWVDAQSDQMNKIAERLERIRENIARACDRVGRNPNKIKLIVVTKTAPVESVHQVVRLGCTDLGENRVQHLKQVVTDVEEFIASESQKAALPAKVNWHMIGHLQRNKVKQVLKLLSTIHSIDTLRLAEEINTQAGRLDITPKVLLQVNCSGEPQKYGVPVGAAVHLAEQIATMPNLKLAGLMTMAPLTRNKDVVRSCFVRAREIFEEIRGEKIVTNQFRHLSMGMSQDYEIAVEEGATMLRIGSAIFA